MFRFLEICQNFEEKNQNANNGPITPENGYYNTANNEVFGYVSTKEAHLEDDTWVQTSLRDIDEVKQFVSDWSEFWDLSGIFLDEVSSAWQTEHKPEWGDHVKFYQEIFEMVKETNPNFRIMLNSTSWVHQCLRPCDSWCHNHSRDQRRQVWSTVRGRRLRLLPWHSVAPGAGQLSTRALVSLRAHLWPHGMDERRLR